MRIIPVIYVISYLLPLLFFFIFKRREKDLAVRVVFFYAVYCILQEVATFLVSNVLPSLRDLLFYLFASYTIIEFTFFCLFYQLLFPKTHQARKYTKWIWIGFVSFALIDYFFISRQQSFDSFAIGIESLILILMCGYYLYYQVTHTMTMMVYNTFNFWVIVTFFMYISATFFLYLMTDAMGKDPEFRKYYLFINFGANFIKNLLLAYAFTRVFIPPVREKKNPLDSINLGDELVLQQNT